MNILHLDSSILGPQSVTRRLSAEFLGVTNFEVVVAEGLDVSPEFREAGLSAAIRQIAETLSA